MRAQNVSGDDSPEGGAEIRVREKVVEVREESRLEGEEMVHPGDICDVIRGEIEQWAVPCELTISWNETRGQTRYVRHVAVRVSHGGEPW